MGSFNYLLDHEVGSVSIVRPRRRPQFPDSQGGDIQMEARVLSPHPCIFLPTVGVILPLLPVPTDIYLTVGHLLAEIFTFSKPNILNSMTIAGICETTGFLPLTVNLLKSEKMQAIKWQNKVINIRTTRVQE